MIYHGHVTHPEAPRLPAHARWAEGWEGEFYMKG